MKDYSVDRKFTVTAKDGTKKEYTVSVAFLPDRSTLSFQKDGKEFASGATFNSKNNVKVTVSAGNIPDALESRVEAEVKSLHKDTPSNGATLSDIPPVTTPKSIAAFPTVSKPAQNTAAQKTKTLELEVIKYNVKNNIGILYLVEAKVFVRPLGTNGAWVEVKTEHRQYAHHYAAMANNLSVDGILEITYDRFIVAKGGESTLKIKMKDNHMSTYKHIAFELESNKLKFYQISFIIKMQSPQKLVLPISGLSSIVQNRFSTTTIVQDYKYEDDTFQIILKDLQKNTFFRLLFVTTVGTSTQSSLPPILVTE